MVVLKNKDYKFPVQVNDFSELYSDGILLIIDPEKKVFSYYNNFYNMPRFLAEETLDKSLTTKDLLAI